jgi:hypothetical protein
MRGIECLTEPHAVRAELADLGGAAVDRTRSWLMSGRGLPLFVTAIPETPPRSWKRISLARDRGDDRGLHAGRAPLGMTVFRGRCDHDGPSEGEQ